MTVLERFNEGDIRALSRIVTFVENREEGYQNLLGGLYKDAGKSLRIGITGPPGAGKSTLASELVRCFIREEKKVGVVAVDPTSPFTGGALLGDRVRMDDLPSDGSVFFRSMATRGATGGLAAATNNVAVVYDAFGFDITLIETVGVGQVELDIIDTCDSVVVVLVPESGDAVQAMKAGLMEIADIFCVNKSDRSGADRMVSDLGMMLETRKTGNGDWSIPIIATEAVNKKNIDELHRALSSHTEYCRSTGRLESHRRGQLEKKILSLLKTRFQQDFITGLSDRVELDRLIDDIRSGSTNPYEVAQELYGQFSNG